MIAGLNTSQGQIERLTFARFVLVAECRSAIVAVQRLVPGESALDSRVYLHGRPGTGKTHLAWALVHEVCRQQPDVSARVIEARDLAGMNEHRERELTLGETAGAADLLVVENLQWLAAPAFESLTQLLDNRQAHQQPTLLTASAAPSQLAGLPARLVNRLISGLVLAIAPYSAPSRLALLEREVETRNLRVAPQVLAWLAVNLAGGSRQLLGALEQLEVLARSRLFPLDVETVARHFMTQVLTERPSIERIAQGVGHHFRVPLAWLQSRQRQRSALLPRQVGMYLARQLTGLPLEAIGAYFGGRDHSTVLHACRKIERILAENVAFSGSVRQLQSHLA